MAEQPDFSKAVKIGSVEAEYAHLRSTLCSCGGPHAGVKQTLLRDSSGKPYDQIDAACAKCGAPRTFLFDISSFFGKPSQEPAPSNRGCLIMMWIFAAAVVAGIVLLVMNDKAPLAFLLGLIAALAILLSKPWKPVTPEERQELGMAGTTATEDKAADIALTLQKLGIPLDLGMTTPQEALLGGMAKAAIYRGVQALEQHRWDDAAASLGPAISTLLKESGPRWNRVLGVAHRLRGRANEGANRLKEALADYERALVLIPDDAEALAARKRLG